MTQANTTVVDALFEAFKQHEPIDFVSHTHNISEREAYQTQDLLIDKLQDVDQSNIAGYKVSMTSAATQSIANTDEPAYGTILSSKIVESNGSVSLSSLFSPLIEPEIMFILTKDVSSNPTNEEVLSSVKVAPGIEIPDARYKNWFPNFTLGDLLADNTATGLIVVGETIEPLSYEDFTNIHMKLSYNGIVEHEGDSTEVLGNPVESVKWLAQKLATHDKKLHKGHIISSGSFISPMPVELGSYKAEYSNVGQVDVTFVD
ncbi:2-keto-4-pentenoate hydratase [Staphylococcus equorum]|uniref:2-keto-4-pentenoate hydratase n=1 Tax=Staphylococcus equorum TaxID=246432 RepID=UPI0039B03019